MKDILKIDKGRNRLRKTLETLPFIELDDLQRLLDADKLIDAKGGRCPVEVAVDAPVYFSCFKLFRPSMGCILFLEQFSEKFFGDDFYKLVVFQAMVLEYGRKPDVLFRKMCSKDRAEKLLLQRMAKADCTVDELWSAVQACFLGFPDRGVVKQGEDNMILAQAAGFAEVLGGDVDFWFWSQSAQKLMWMQQERSEAMAMQEGNTSPGMARAVQAYLALQEELFLKYEVK